MPPRHLQKPIPAKKAPIRQPQANFPKPPLYPKPVEKTPGEIAEEKIRKMALDPKAIPVYWTENGPDAKGWDIICPEYRILNEAFKGGFSWYDLTEGHGRHLLPEPKPYKIVHVTKEELKVIRAREAEEEALIEAERLAEVKAQERRWREEAEARGRVGAEAAAAAEAEALVAAEAEALAAAAEAEALAAAEAAAADEREAMAREDTLAIEIRYREDLEIATDKLIEKIAAMPEEFCTEDNLAELIVDEIRVLPEKDQIPMAEKIVRKVEARQLVFVTPCSSPYPELADPEPSVPSVPLDVPWELVWVCYLLLAHKEFVESAPYFHGDTMYQPVVSLKGERAYYPFKIQTLSPPPPLPSGPPPPLPVVKARIVPTSELRSRRGPLLPTPSTPPIKIRKMRMPRMQRLNAFLSQPPLPKGPPPPLPPSTMRNWHDQATRQQLISSF